MRRAARRTLACKLADSLPVFPWKWHPFPGEAWKVVCSAVDTSSKLIGQTAACTADLHELITVVKPRKSFDILALYKSDYYYYYY